MSTRAGQLHADQAVAHRLERSTGELTAWELLHPTDEVAVPQRVHAITR